MENLVHAAQCIFRKENLILGLTGEFNFKDLLEGHLSRFGNRLYAMPCVKATPKMEMQKLNEGFRTSSKVQYVATAGRFEREGQDYTGALRVLKDYFFLRLSLGEYPCHRRRLWLYVRLFEKWLRLSGVLQGSASDCHHGCL